MKTRHFPGWSLGLAFSVLPFVAGCNQQPEAAPKDPTNTVSSQPASTTTVTMANSLPVADESQPIPAPPTQKTLPPTIKPSASLSEIIRLADAGVDESVMLAYVNSSQGTFNLGSDEIIYLTDLGVPDEVVTSMIERDQVLIQSWATPAQVAAATAAEITNEQATESNVQPVAAAPTYVNQPEPYPAEQPAQVVNYNYFYDNLAPYGSWAQVDNYGWCWQPTVVSLNRSWQPYCDRGRWLYTDAGWYWQSDYSWGLTFHYGRWFNHPNRGWCWAPDRVWGPAWVTWRYNDNYCGWAPLPPRCTFTFGVGLAYGGVSVGVGHAFGLAASCYTFVPWRSVCDPRPYRHRLPASQTTVAVRDSTVINNIIIGDNNTIINRGIAPERVREITRTPVRRVALRDAQRRTGLGSAFYRGDLQGRASGRSSAAATSDSRPSRTSATLSQQTVGRPDAGLTVGRGNNSAANRLPYARDRRQSDSSSAIVERNDTTQTGRSRVGSRSPESLIVNGSDASSRQATPQNAPPGSLIVTGNGEKGRSRAQGRFTQPSAGGAETSLAEDNTASPSITSENRDSTTTPQPARRSDNNMPAVQTAPTRNGSSRSLVIIGQPNNAQPRGQIRVVQPPASNTSQQDRVRSSDRAGQAQGIVASAPQAGATTPTVARTPNITQTWSAPAQIQRPDTSRVQQRSATPFNNRPSAPAVNRSSAPTAPSYTPRAPAAQSYTPRAPTTPSYAPRATPQRPAQQQIRQSPVPRQPSVSVAPRAPAVRSAPSQSVRSQSPPPSAPSSDNSSSTRNNGGGGRRR